MEWIAPSEKDTAMASLEKSLWDTADQFRANSGLKAQEYSGPILGLIFLRFAEVRFNARRAALAGQPSPGSASHPLPKVEGKGEGVGGRRRGNRADDPTAYHAEGILYLPEAARFDYLLNLPEAENIGGKVNEAMRGIEQQNPQLAGVLPKTYNLFSSTLLKELLKKISEIPATADFDAFGRIYEYFLGAFARTEGQKGGEFYTPACIVRLLTEVIEPFHGRILDPACGSGGMFVQSARFVAEHMTASPSLHSSPGGRASDLPSASGRGVGGEGAPCELRYQDIPGFCRAASNEEIEQQTWSLNPGRYVGVAPGEVVNDEDFKEQFEELNEELENLNAEARELESVIAKNAAEILEA